MRKRKSDREKDGQRKRECVGERLTKKERERERETEKERLASYF